MTDPTLAARVADALAWKEPEIQPEDLLTGPYPHWITPPNYRALLVEAAAALAAAGAREARLAEALDKEEGLADAMALSDTMRYRYKAMGRHRVIQAVRAALEADHA